MVNKSVRLTPVGVLEALPKDKKYLSRDNIISNRPKLPTMFKPKDTKRYPLEYTMYTYVYSGKIYPYNSKKRGWVSEQVQESV